MKTTVSDTSLRVPGCRPGAGKASCAALAFLLLFLCGCAARTVSRPDAAAALARLSDHYEAFYTSEPIVIDGDPGDAAWEKAGVLNFIVYDELTVPLSPTSARVLWDDDYLYVLFEARDKDVWGYLRRRNDPTFREDVFEIFFKTDPGDTAYYNFEINALGTVYDAFSPDWNFAGGTHRWSRWNCEGLKVGVRVRGTLNDPSAVDEGWDMEVAIPFRSLESAGGRAPECGETWKFHLARYDYSVYLPGDGREISSTVPFEAQRAGFHYHEAWKPLIFRRAGPGGP